MRANKLYINVSYGLIKPSKKFAQPLEDISLASIPNRLKDLSKVSCVLVKLIAIQSDRLGVAWFCVYSKNPVAVKRKVGNPLLEVIEPG